MGGISRAYIGLGSNLRNPRLQVERGLAALATLPRSRCVAHSALYGSVPVGPPQPDYVNAVAALDTSLEPLMLLDALQALEARQGRVREEGVRWGPRVLDLDLLLYDALIVDEPRLTLPHPELSQRDFVLYPLYEIAPHLNIPRLGSLQDLVGRCHDRGLIRMTSHDAAQTS